ncbi:hypothetical protein FHT40_006224 [Mycolicibacterium sp. BK556]|uniref:hypothetical protein n=1 Tax=Mycobacteriaceae TaxID=1762 RepID=UPI000D36166B|nr:MULTISPECIES: hypothetical protein [Mycobacteriaceae]MBB3606533.1 hypothetical protein [Mycolicibacterium sp. BK556]MBB3636221.1 hypothetical protein [Mycolicibacterium sp. BK607]MBB3753513.1 hypothetical protein [Mycolicibacterium sp. BK634]
MTSPDATGTLERDNTRTPLSGDNVLDQWVEAARQQRPAVPSGTVDQQALRALIAGGTVV